MRVGWARPGCLPDQELGSDDQAFVFDGFKVAGLFFALHIPVVQFLGTSVEQCTVIKMMSKLVINGASVSFLGPALAPG